MRPAVLTMRDRRVRPAASFVTILVERLYDTASVFLFFALNLLWFTPVGGTAEQIARTRRIGILLVSIVIVAVVFLIWFRRQSKTVISWLDVKINAQSRLARRIKLAILSTLEQLATALGVLSNPRGLAITIGWSVLLWFSVAVANLIVFRAFGLPFGMSHALFVLGWSISTGAYRYPIEQAAAIAIVLHLVDFGPAALFGLFYFLRGDVNLTRLRSMSSASAVEHSVEDEDVLTGKAKHLEVIAANK